MFTGIVQGRVPVTTVERGPGTARLVLELGSTLSDRLTTGASIAVDGVCLTVTAVDDTAAHFDVMGETLRLTSLGDAAAGREVNVERAARYGDEIGGHQVSGHVSGTAEITAIERPDENHVVHFRVEPTWMRYIFPKGFIALDGASLTVVDVDNVAGTFSVWLIPETLRLTTFGVKGIGDRVNFEIDAQTLAIVDTVEAVLADRLGPREE